MLLANRRLYEVVVNHHDKHLHKSHKATWCLALLVVFLVPLGTREEHHNKDDYHNPYLRYRLRNTQVEWTYRCAVGHLLIYLSVMLLVEVEALGKTVSRTEMPLPGILAADNDGQRNT